MNPDGRKLPGFRFDGSGKSFQSASVEGVKQGRATGSPRRARAGRDGTSASYGSKSSARKMASAMIAKIPEPLARHIAQVYYPATEPVEKTAAVWLPKSRVEFEERGMNPTTKRQHDPETIVVVTLPEELATEKGLVSDALPKWKVGIPEQRRGVAGSHARNQAP